MTVRHTPPAHVLPEAATATGTDFGSASGRRYICFLVTSAKHNLSNLFIAAPNTSRRCRGWLAADRFCIFSAHSRYSWLARSILTAPCQRHPRSPARPFLLIGVWLWLLPPDSLCVGLTPASFTRSLASR